MKQVFYTAFERDLKKIKDKKIAFAIKQLLATTSQCKTIQQLPNLKKMTGHPTAYRIRIGNYRVGIFIEQDIIYFAAIDQRKNIYRRFP